MRGFVQTYRARSVGEPTGLPESTISGGEQVIVSWFSAGVSSAVATWLMRDQIDKIVYIHIEDQHEDTLRFLHDCEEWFNREIEILQSPYKSVDNVIQQFRYINGVAGAKCTQILKKASP